MSKYYSPYTLTGGINQTNRVSGNRTYSTEFPYLSDILDRLDKYTMLRPSLAFHVVDDFWGDTIDSRWTTGATSGSVGIHASSNENNRGEVKLSTTATTPSNASMDWASYRSLRTDSFLMISYRMKPDDLAGQRLRFGLYGGASDYVYLEIDGNVDDNVDFKSAGGLAGTLDIDTGLDFEANVYHTYSIALEPTKRRAYCYEDDVLFYTSPVNPIVFTENPKWTPYVLLTNISADACDVFFDYVEILNMRV